MKFPSKIISNIEGMLFEGRTYFRMKEQLEGGSDVLVDERTE
jgi:hypothetical protein